MVVGKPRGYMSTGPAGTVSDAAREAPGEQNAQCLRHGLPEDLYFRGSYVNTRKILERLSVHCGPSFFTLHSTGSH